MSEKPFNDLTPAEVERLALLSEELGEAQQAIGKILRHGYESRNPLDPKHPGNRRALEKELGDVRSAILLLAVNGDVDSDRIALRTNEKTASVRKYLHHQGGTR